MQTEEQKERLHQLITTYHRPIFKYCYHMLRHKQESEDATQEIFIKAITSVHSAEHLDSESAWLFKIAHNHCLNVIKRKKLLGFIPIKLEFLTNNSAQSEYDNFENAVIINEILSQLPPQDRSIVLLRTIQDRSFDEIGTIINMNPATVRKRFERAKKKLKSAYVNEEGEIADETETISVV